MSEKVEGEYGAEQIQVLDGLEHIRKRPGMYISSTDAKGLHHLVHEVVDNSIDEALAGYCTHIEVVLNADGSCTVSDNGRGIPTDIHPKEGISTLEVVFTKVNAGGKFGGDSGYKVSSGLHGVGVKAVNALSEWLEAEVFQNGHVYKQVYNRGVPQRSVAVVGDSDKTGTRVTFMLRRGYPFFRRGAQQDPRRAAVPPARLFRGNGRRYGVRGRYPIQRKL